MITLTVNGSETPYNGPPDIDSLLNTLKIPADRTATILNDQVIIRELRKTTTIKEQDCVEILTFAGGG